MRKVILGILASVFLVSTAAAYKVEPLTNDERAEVRARADRLREEQEHQSMHANEMHHKATHHKTMHHHDQPQHEAAKTY